MLTFESAQSLGVAGILEKLTVRHVTKSPTNYLRVGG
jgi:hypothetical protein